MKLVQTILGGGGGSARLLALAALLGLLAAAALSLAPAAAEGELEQFELVLSLEEDSDNVVPAGSELTVNAVLRFPWQLPITPPADQPSYVPYKLDVPGAGSALSRLRISGNLEWDSAGRQRLELAAQTLIQSNHSGPGFAWTIKAFDGRTIVARPVNAKVLHIHDSYTLAHAATINQAGTGGNHNSGFGGSDARQTGSIGTWKGKAIDVWHETADRAWLFVGSWADTADSESDAGRLYRYRLDWDDEGVTVTPMGALAPPRTESRNRHGQTWAWYGAAVAFSRDGSTLAVTAPRMNMMGAVYVYSRPDGPGEDWGDVEYADGVKVSVGEVPAFGVSFGEMPFNPNSASGCDAWCSMVWSSAARESNHIAGLGSQRVSLSADGRVLVVGNGTKPYSLTTPGGSFNNANRRDNAGEAYVWIAPEAGWQSAPLANRDAEGNRRTVFAAKTNATSFRRATHYSPGPLRRWTEPAAVLAPAAWPNVGGNEFGREAVVSADGSTVAVGNSSNAVYIFQRDSAGDWASAAGGYLTPDATLSGLWPPDEGPMHFSPDGRELAVGQIGGNVVRVFSRPADGTWVSATGATARVVGAPAGFSTQRFGSVIPELSGQRVAIANQGTKPDFLTYPILSAASGCTTSTVDGETTASCPLTLPGSTITIPEGTPDGPFVISGNVTLQPNGGDPITLRSTLEVTIGKVKEVDSAALALATDIGDPTTIGDEKPYPSLLRTQGESTRLLLRILNEHGAASHAGSVAAVLISSSAGNLGVLDADLEGDVCAGISCQLDSSEINANNADRLVITLTHAGKAANAQVRATVFSTAGDSFATEPVSIVLAGPADSIAVASSTSGVLNTQAAGTDADGSTESDAADLEDARDHLLLAVTATDAAGNSVALPPGARRGQVLDPDGVRVTSGVRVIFPHRGDPTALVSTDNAAITNAAGAQQVRIDVDRAPTNPLVSGEYTLEVWVGQKKATRTFIVSGGPVSDGISLSDPGAVAVGESFTVTATFNDASGAAVPNGTEVDWPEIVTASGAGQQVVLTGKDTRTTDGRASATWLAVNSGSVVVTAGYNCAESVTSRGDAAVGDCEVSGVRLVRIADAEQAAVATSLVDGLSSRNPVNYSSWIGEGSTTAAELLSALDDVNSLLIWLDGEWIRYGLSDGREIPGSIDFSIAPGAILWLGR